MRTSAGNLPPVTLPWASSSRPRARTYQPTFLRPYIRARSLWWLARVLLPAMLPTVLLVCVAFCVSLPLAVVPVRASGLTIVGTNAMIPRPPASCTRDGFTAVGGATVIPVDEEVCGDLTLIGGATTILGRVSGNVTVMGGALTLTGEVMGDVVVLGGNVTVLSGARVLGSVRALGGQVRFERGAAQGNVVHGFAAADGVSGLTGEVLGSGQALIASLLFWLGAALLLVLLFPGHLATVSATARTRAAASLLAGMLVAGVGLLLGVVLVLTCLGIPIAALLVLSFWLAWVLGTVAIGSWLGEVVVGAFWHTHADTPRAHPGYGWRGAGRVTLLPTLLGTGLLTLAKAVPCGGTLLALVVGFGGLGAVTLRLYAALAPRSGTLAGLG